MKKLLSGLVVIVLGISQVAYSQARTNSMTVGVNLQGKGITGITPTSCTFVAGTGSANTQVCQLTATTIPPNQIVTFLTTLTGTDAAKFAITSSGMISVGPVDLPLQTTPWQINVTATGQ